MIDDPRFQAIVDRSAKSIRDIAKRVPEKYWPELFEQVGIEALAKEASKVVTTEPTLEDATELDIEMLGNLSLHAMKQGMTGPNPNAQMVRTFHAWKAEQEGLKQLQSVEIHIVPGEVDDKMSEQLFGVLRELTELANS